MAIVAQLLLAVGALALLLPVDFAHGQLLIPKRPVICRQDYSLCARDANTSSVDCTGNQWSFPTVPCGGKPFGLGNANTSFVRASQVRSLSVTNTPVEVIYNNSFVAFGRLLTLNLSNNNITSLRANAFGGLANLEALDISNNRLEHIRNFLFSNLGSLQELDVSGNLLTMITRDLFRGLTSLQRLDLSNNYIDTVFSGSLVDLTSLQSLNLQGNAISFIPKGVFLGAENLQTLDLSNNSLVWLTSSAFSNVPRVKFINVSRNMLDTILFSTFVVTPELEILDLSRNRLTFIPRSSAAWPKTLKELYLSDNNLTSISYRMWRSLGQLQRLELHCNLFTTVVGAFPNRLPATLDYLTLHQNQISTFPDAFFSRSNLSTLTLHENPIDCCRLEWKAPVQDILNCTSEPCAVCQVPMAFRSAPISDVPSPVCVATPWCPDTLPDPSSVDPYAMNLDSCPDSKFGSTCPMACQPGFSPNRQTTAAWVCESNQQWTSNLSCVDTTLRSSKIKNVQESKLQFSRRPATWAVAEQICQIRQGHLLVVDSPKEEALVARFMAVENLLTESVWIGARVGSDGLQLESPNGTPLTYVPPSFDAPTTPTSGCIAVAASMETQVWQLRDCGQKKRYICELP